jgi:hypothetical protein
MLCPNVTACAPAQNSVRYVVCAAMGRAWLRQGKAFADRRVTTWWQMRMLVPLRRTNRAPHTKSPRSRDAQCALKAYALIVSNKYAAIVGAMRGFAIAGWALAVLLSVAGVVVQVIFNEPNPMLASGLRLAGTSALLSFFLWLTGKSAQQHQAQSPAPPAPEQSTD